MAEEEKTLKKHGVTIEDRKNARISGVNEVLGYDPTAISLSTDHGELVIGGSGLHIGSFERGSGILEVSGNFDSLQYINTKPQNESFLARLLR